jgi:hypothetical protein
MSGSGPTLWVLYPTVADAAAAADVVRTVFAEGAIAAPGDGPPTVAASAILTGPASMPGRQP